MKGVGVGPGDAVNVALGIRVGVTVLVAVGGGVAVMRITCKAQAIPELPTKRSNASPKSHLTDRMTTSVTKSMAYRLVENQNRLYSSCIALVFSAICRQQKLCLQGVDSRYYR